MIWLEYLIYQEKFLKLQNYYITVSSEILSQLLYDTIYLGDVLNTSFLKRVSSSS